MRCLSCGETSGVRDPKGECADHGTGAYLVPAYFTVTPSERGWTFAGWSGETPREAIMEAYLNGVEGLTIDSPYEADGFNNGLTGRAIDPDTGEDIPAWWDKFEA